MDSSRQNGGGYSGSRRDFIKIAAASLGGTLLTGASVGCGGGGIGSIGGNGGNGLNTHVGVGVMPNGYRFYRVFTPGGGSGLGDVVKLTGGVMNNTSTILFYAEKSSGAAGIFQISMDYSAETPRIIDVPSVLMEQGQMLSDSVQVEKINSAALNDLGESSACAVVAFAKNDLSVEPRLRGTPAVWQADGADFERIVSLGSPTPVGGKFGANLGDVSINDDGDILLVASYSQDTDQGIHLAQGLFQLRNGQSDSGVLLGTTGGMTGGGTGGANSTPSKFGICDFDNRGNYVAQTFYNDSATVRSGGVTARITGGSRGRNLQAVSANVGNTYFGPRVDGGTHTSVIHLNDTQHALYYNGNELTRTGGQSPQGRLIHAVGPGSVSNDVTHFLVMVDNGMELVVSNGSAQKTILKYGDLVANSDKQIRGIVHGFHADQADADGRIVLVGEFEDGSQSVVVGIPY
ncbi:hypothetical protein EON79_08720 [bacterium]|nr:MAG: hypothetical protein EON79_08720 [bacterium]